MKSIIVVLLASCLFLFGKINVFYLKTDKCNKCSNTSIESYINNLPESNDSKNILIFDKKNEDLEYLFGKNGIFDTIMVDNGKFSDFVKIKSSSDLSLIIFDQSGNIVFKRTNLRQNSVIKSSFQYNDKILNRENLNFEGIYDLSIDASDSSFYYITNYYDNEAYIYNKKSNKFINNELIDEIRKKFVNETDNKWLESYYKKQNYKIGSFSKINNKIILNCQNDYKYTKSYDYKRNLPVFTWEDKSVFYRIENGKIVKSTSVKSKADSINAMCYLDSLNLICDYIPYPLEKRHTDKNPYYLFVYNIKTDNYKGLLKFSDINWINDLKRYQGIGSIFEFVNSKYYYNAHLELIAEITDNEIHNTYRLSEIIGKDSLKVFVNSYIIDVFENYLYINIFKNNKHLDKIYRINKNFELEDVFYFPKSINENYSKIHLIENNNMFVNLLVKDKKEKWYELKIPYAIMIK